MSLADEMLNDLVSDSVEPHIVIGRDRKIVVPDQLKRIAVQYDHNVETVTFDCPRYWDEHDMSKMLIYINYILPDNTPGKFIAENIAIDENDDTIMHFTWTISKYITQNNGNIQVQICIKDVDEDGYEQTHWNSELSKDMYISKGLECWVIDESVVDDNIDLIAQILRKIDDINEGSTTEDIKTALDTILAIQNELIGGDI